ncbi:MAG: hypothetical protein RL672_1290 [Actinomycetota bacterium]
MAAPDASAERSGAFATYSETDGRFDQGVRRLVAGLGGPQSFNALAIVLYAIPGLLSTLLFDRIRFGGDLGKWTLVALSGYFVVVVLYLAGGRVYRRLLPKIGARPYLVLFYFALLGLARSFVIFWLGTEWKLIPATDWLFRLLGGPVFTGATLGIGVVVGIIFANSAAEGVRLRGERRRLSELSQTMQQRIETQRAELAGRVQGILAPALEDVRRHLANANESRQIIGTLSHTIDEVVRPLSHNIANADDTLITDSSAGRPGRRSAIGPFHPISVGGIFLPGVSALLITVSALPAAVALRPGLGGAAMAVVEGLVILLSLSAMRQLVGRLRLPILFATIFVALTFTGSQWFVIWVIGELGMHLTAQQTINVYAFGYVFGSFVAAGQALQLARGMAVGQLREVTSKLALLVSRLRQEVWLNNRRMASVLHGPVQAALYAAGMKLSQAKEIGPELVSEVEGDIAHALERLDSVNDLQQRDFAEVINEIVSLWRGSCEISVFTTEECSLALRRDMNAAACVVEVVQESISNAIKHGKASNASVMISLLGRSLVEVRVRNDGKPLAIGATGLGSQILDEICHNWSIEDRSKGVLLIATIALAT